MSATISNRPSSGARLLGDDLQHLIGWYWALAVLKPNDIEHVEIEAVDAGNVDDVVVRRRIAADIYTQVKASVDATTPVTVDWLTAPSKSGGPSILQRFFAFWSKNKQAELRLITNKSLDSADPLLSLRDAHGRLADGIRRPKRSREIDGAVGSIITHLESDESTLIEFLEHLHLDTDASISTWEQRVIDLSSPHLRADTSSILAGIGWLRQQVQRTRPVLDRTAVMHAIDKLDLWQAPAKATVAVAALAPVHSEDALLYEDLRPYFDRPGEPLGARRWAEVSSRIEGLGAHCLAAGETDIEVRATCRLPTWFAIGRSLRDTQGFDVSTLAHGQSWTSASNAALVDANILTVETLSSEADGAAIVIVSVVADDPTAEILHYLEDRELAGHVVRIRRAEPARSIDPSQGQALALAIRNEVRDACRQIRPHELHVFLVCPGPVALLLGRLWDRLPATTTYEYLGIGAGYETAITLDAT